MPVDRDSWVQELNLSNFVNTYYQYRDLRSLPNCIQILIIGPGQGLDTLVLTAFLGTRQARLPGEGSQAANVELL